MMELRDRFLEFDRQQGLQLANHRLLLAVSGGVDSVVLAHLCQEAGLNFAIAHCNFRLRGTESDEDAAFVRQLAADLSVAYFEKEFDTSTYAQENKVGIQVAARELRYSWFNELLSILWDAHSPFTIHHSPRPLSGQALHVSRILTGHHRDDSIETLLINFLKGTGIGGLHGILPKQNQLLRPLLFAGRDEILAYANSRSLTWREDSSNAESKYTRNYLRNELLPAIEKIFPQVRQNLAANIGRFAEVEIIYRQSVELQVKKMLEWHGKEARVPVRKLLKTTPLDSILYELAKPFGFTSAQLPTLRLLLESQAGRQLASSSHRAIRHGAWLLFAPLQAVENTVYVLEKKESSIFFGDNELAWQFLPAPPAELNTGTDMALLDADAVAFPLILRRWKAGDYFYPLGMRKKKKIARYLIDKKLSITEKENTWVIESHKKIIWVTGRRIDDRFKITPATQSVLQLQVRTVNPR
jgi:tRNA(Ile)-lysidine synthase